MEGAAGCAASARSPRTGAEVAEVAEVEGAEVGAGFFVFTKVHVTPCLRGSSTIELGELPSLQVADVSVQPSGIDSLTEVRARRKRPERAACSPVGKHELLTGRASGLAGREELKTVGSPAGVRPLDER